MVSTLTDRAEQQVADYLVTNWTPADVRGYDPTASPSADAHFPIATTIDDVGAVYPSLVCTFSNETIAGSTGYSFLTSSGPGSAPDGQVVVTARASDAYDYTGDSGTYSAVDAEAITKSLMDAVDDIIRAAPTMPSGTDFSTWGTVPANPPNDDREDDDTVFLEQRVVTYSWIQDPP